MFKEMTTSMDSKWQERITPKEAKLANLNSAIIQATLMVTMVEEIEKSSWF